jgi:manganese/iron transport system substrate-binding protein
MRVGGVMLVLVLGAVLFGGVNMTAAAEKTERMKVVTSFTVIADIARHVAGDAADVESITKPGAEIHDYQPTPRDIVRGAQRRYDPLERHESGTLV